MASTNILNVGAANFDSDVLKASVPVLVDFWAEWCGPCKMLAPVLDELAQELGANARVAKVNIDHNQDLAVQFGITSIPTLLLFKGGKVVGQTVGLKSKVALKTLVEGAIAAPAPKA